VAKEEGERDFIVYPRLAPGAKRVEHATGLGVVPVVVFPDDPDERELEEARWWDVRATPPLPFDLKIRVGMVGDRLVCTGLRISSDRDVSARDLRLVKLPEILAAAARSAVARDPAFSRAMLGYELRPTMRKPRLLPRYGPPAALPRRTCRCIVPAARPPPSARPLRLRADSAPLGEARPGAWRNRGPSRLRAVRPTTNRKGQQWRPRARPSRMR
jgi:hypothetical protein